MVLYCYSRCGTSANLKKRLRAASHNCEGHDTPIDDTADLSRTIGFNNFDNDEQDVWMTAGWNWCNDYFTEGNGVPVLWRKFPK